MKHWWTAALLLISVTGVALAQPKLEISQNKFDFGVAPQNSTIVESFWFKSIGTDTVTFTKVTTGCDCATAPLKQMFVAPGDSLLVPFFWQTQHKIGPSGRYPYFFSNIGPDPTRLSLTADVLAGLDSTYPISFKPYKIELTKMPTMSVDSVLFEITNRDTVAYSVAQVSYPVEQCDIVLPEIIAAGEKVKGLVRLKPAFADEPFEQSVTLSFFTSDGRLARYTIPIRRKFIGVASPTGS